MVGILLDEPRTGGPQPSLKVLEIFTVDAKRSTRDLLPYLPEVRMMFSPLPNKVSRVGWSVAQVLLDDVECLTQTLVKVKGPHWYIKIPKGNSILTATYRSIYERY